MLAHLQTATNTASSNSAVSKRGRIAKQKKSNQGKINAFQFHFHIFADLLSSPGKGIWAVICCLCLYNSTFSIVYRALHLVNTTFPFNKVLSFIFKWKTRWSNRHEFSFPIPFVISVHGSKHFDSGWLSNWQTNRSKETEQWLCCLIENVWPFFSLYKGIICEQHVGMSKWYKSKYVWIAWMQ